MRNDIATIDLTDTAAPLTRFERVEGPWDRTYVVWAEGITSGTMESMNLDEVGNMATNDISTAPEWLMDYMRMIEGWAQAFDRDAVHLTQEEYDALFNDPQLAGLEGL